MVPKELLGNEEEGKRIPFLGSQKKGTKKGNTQPSAKEQVGTVFFEWRLLHIYEFFPVFVAT